MNYRNKLLAALILAMACAALALTPAHADDRPPPGAMALSMVLTKLEQQGYTPIIEASLENEQWKVKAYKEGEKYQLTVNPNSGEIIESYKEDS